MWAVDRKPLQVPNQPDLISIGIDPQEVFPHLSKAPITEAVIEIRANTETEWTEELITPRLKEKLSNYPNVKPERAWSQEWQFQADHEPEQRIGQ